MAKQEVFGTAAGDDTIKPGDFPIHQGEESTEVVALTEAQGEAKSALARACYVPMDTVLDLVARGVNSDHTEFPALMAATADLIRAAYGLGAHEGICAVALAQRTQAKPGGVPVIGDRTEFDVLTIGRMPFAYAEGRQTGKYKGEMIWSGLGLVTREQVTTGAAQWSATTEHSKYTEAINNGLRNLGADMGGDAKQLVSGGKRRTNAEKALITEVSGYARSAAEALDIALDSEEYTALFDKMLAKAQAAAAAAAQVKAAAAAEKSAAPAAGNVS